MEYIFYFLQDKDPRMLQLIIQRLGANVGDLHLNMTASYTPTNGGSAGMILEVSHQHQYMKFWNLSLKAQGSMHIHICAYSPEHSLLTYAKNAR